MINDTWGQIQSFVHAIRGDGSLWDHHPVLTSVIMGSAITWLEGILGHWRRAIFVFMMGQAFCSAFAFAHTVCYTHRKLKLPVLASLMILLMYCLLPIYPASVQTISKDAMSAWIFVLFSFIFMEGIRTEGETLNHWGYIFCLTGLGLLCALTKKVNVYVIIFSLLGMAVWGKGKRARLLAPIVIIVGFMFPGMSAIRTQFNIIPDGIQEMFSLPFLQTARYVKEHPEDISEQEYEILDHLLGMSDLADRYRPRDADHVKGYFNRGEMKDYIQYLKAWFAQGFRHPKSYVDAAKAMLSGWFSFEKYEPLTDMSNHSQQDLEMIPVFASTREGLFAETSETYRLIYDRLYRNPLSRLFFSYGFYAVIMPTFLLLLSKPCQRGKKWQWIVMLPMLFSIVLGCFLAPLSTQVEGRRYLYPVTYTIPLILAWCIYTSREYHKGSVSFIANKGQASGLC